MSAQVTSVSSVSLDSATAAPTAGGSASEAAAGETYVVSDANTSTTAASVTIPAGTTSGTVNLAVATPGAMLSVSGEGTATLSVGGASDSSGNALDQSGAAIGISDSYAGKVVADFSSSYVSSNATVNADAKLGGSESSIGDNAPAGLFSSASAKTFGASDAPNLYINTGIGDDEIGGSDKNDFIRAGAGADTVNAGAGNDIVRTGSGSDTATLGKGDDSLYVTVDQIVDGDVDTITDFDSSGDDTVLINSDIEGLLTITGQGTNTITLALSGDQAATSTITSNGGTIDADDIEFV